jgi:hypothetical protein
MAIAMTTIERAVPPAQVQRVVVVRCGATKIYESLAAKYAHDLATLIVYDRRRESRPVGSDERRGSPDAEILRTRGFYVQRVMTPPKATACE